MRLFIIGFQGIKAYIPESMNNLE